MGSFTTQPSGAQAVYHPIKYLFDHNSTLAIESVRAVIEFVDAPGTSFYYTIRVPYSAKTLVAGTTYKYSFNIDVSAFCKQKLPPFTYQVSSAFRFGSTSLSNIDNGDFWGKVRITCHPEYRNAQGVLVDDTGNATSNYSNVLTASFRRSDTKNLNSYVTTSTTTKFLTKRDLSSTTQTKWCLNDENSLSVFFAAKTITTSPTSEILLNWESLDGLVGGDYVLTKNQAGQITVGLNAIFTAISNAGQTKFKMRIGSRTPATTGTFSQITEWAYITLDRNCCSGTTFSWLNELGGVDSYTFCGELETQFSVSNEYGQQYDDGLTTRLKGIYKTSSEVGEVINVRDLLSAADLDWIKYILASHEVYVKIGAAWYNCVITDASAITESNIEGMYDFSFTARLSDVVVNHN